jgi:hypothetical protein
MIGSGVICVDLKLLPVQREGPASREIMGLGSVTMTMTMKFGLALFFLLALPASSAPLGSLSGLWVLDGVERDGKITRDPRWTARLDVTATGKITFSSQSVTEIRLSHGKTKSSTENITLKGEGRMVGDTLEIRWEPNSAREELLRTHFGIPDQNGVTRLPLQMAGSLRLQGPNGVLQFVRHEKPER